MLEIVVPRLYTIFGVISLNVELSVVLLLSVLYNLRSRVRVRVRPRGRINSKNSIWQTPLLRCLFYLMLTALRDSVDMVLI